MCSNDFHFFENISRIELKVITGSMSKINIYASDSRGQEEKREECFSFFPLGVGDGVRSSSWKLQDVGWTK